MSKNNKICIASADLLKSADKALSALEKASKHAKRLAKFEKRAIASILDLEAALEDAKACKCAKKPKVKKSKKKKKNLANKNAKSSLEKAKTSEIMMATAADIDEPLLSIKSLDNTLSEPRDGKADELHLIAGVGPKLEELLHGLGVFHFDQIASWTQNEIDWVDDYLQFPGRIERDDWVEQAKALAKGGRDEYVRVFGKEPR